MKPTDPLVQAAVEAENEAWRKMRQASTSTFQSRHSGAWDPFRSQVQRGDGATFIANGYPSYNMPFGLVEVERTSGGAIVVDIGSSTISGLTPPGFSDKMRITTSGSAGVIYAVVNDDASYNLTTVSVEVGSSVPADTEHTGYEKIGGWGYNAVLDRVMLYQSRYGPIKHVNAGLGQHVFF